MNTTRRNFLISSALASAGWLAGCNKGPKVDPSGKPLLRVGFFPNITHAQGVIGYEESKSKGDEGWFEKATGAKIEWLSFNAGPSAMEALERDLVDVTYVGPNPVLNGYIRSNTEDFRVLTGSARGGVALVIQKGSGLKQPADFRGKKIATPQLGNTQDVSARAWLIKGGLKVTQTGGEAQVVPTLNPDQLDLFKQKALDAVWTVEPWVSRLEMEADAEILIQQDDTFITLIATGVKALETKAELLKKFLAAHDELTKKIAAEPDFAKPLVSAGLKRATTRPIPEALLNHAWPRLKFTTALDAKDFETAMSDAKLAGLLPKEAPLDKLFVKL